MTNMFKPSRAKTVSEYISQIDEPRRTEIKKIHTLIKKTLPTLKPFLEGSIIGYGKMHYKTKSGREGDWFTVGLASQKQHISVYICSVKNGKYIPEIYKDDLGNASIGKSCIRFKKLEDLNKKTLVKALKEAEKTGIMSF
jgi:hypothetical protein